MSEVKIQLPEFPIVFAEGYNVIIKYRDGTKLEWGDESTVEEALLVAKELELELKAISYVKWHVRNFIFDMRKKLGEINIPESHLDEILVEGHKFAHGELDLSTAEMIRISSKKKIKDEIIEKIVPDFQTYIS